MALKFLDLETGLPRLWQQVLGKIETHNNSETSHQNIRDEISSLTSTVSNKVDKVSGKQLSTNDFTTAEKNKLAGLSNITVDSSLSSSSTNPVQNKVINSALSGKASTSTTDSLQSSINTLNTKVATAATTSSMGMMSAADKTKLEGIAAGATKITVDSSLSSSSTNPVQNKVINTALNNKVATSTYNTKVSSLESSISSVESALTTFKNTKGAASGIAPLNASGQIDSTYLPSYVDDVLEYTAKSNFPTSGETGKIYVDTSTNLTYRWSGTAYVEISPSLALGTTSSTAFRGDYGNTAYSHATAKGSAFSSGLYKITTNAQGHVTAATTVAKADITALGIPAQDTTYSAASSSAAGLMSASDKSKLDGIASNANNYSLPTASSTTLGGVKTGYSASGKNYAVQLDSSNKMYVNVPWENTTYTSLKNPNALTISLNGTSQGAYDGSTAKSFNITASSIGAATSEHTHELENLTGTLSLAKGGTGATDAATALTNLGAVAKSGDTMTGDLTISKVNGALNFIATNTSTSAAIQHLSSRVQATAKSKLELSAKVSDTVYTCLSLSTETTADKALSLKVNGTSYDVYHSGMTAVIPIANGGTGAATATEALANLGGVGYTVVTNLNSLL